MRVDRFLLLLATVLLGCTTAATAAGAAPAHGGAAKRKLIVAPKPRQVLGGNTVTLAVRNGPGLRLRLNRRWISPRELGRARHGVRRMQASISQGLRPGPNVLRAGFKQPRHKGRKWTTVRFRLSPGQELVGAGTDQVAALGSVVKLAADLEPGQAGGGGGGTDAIDWTPIRTPEDQPSCEPPKTAAELRSPEGPTASFMPELPGEYEYRVTEGSGADAVSDVVSVDASPANRSVPIETMAGDPSKPATEGILVGKLHYLLSEATAAGGAEHAGLQMLVLKRHDLRCVSNTKFAKIAELQAALAKLKTSEMAIVSMQPGAAGSIDGKALYDALGTIGFPTEAGKAMPVAGGSFSGIGVTGMPRGDAYVDILPSGTNETASMSGYLMPDQYGNFGYVPAQSQAFKWIPEPFEPCTAKSYCEDHTGYEVHAMNPRTLKTVADKFFSTGAAKGSAARVEEMIAELAALPKDTVVEVVSASDRTAAENTFPPSVSPISQGLYNRLMEAIAGLGGTRNAFNRTAFSHGSLASSGQTYVLVGWKGAKEGEAAEAAANVYGQGDAPRLTGILRPDRRSLMRPAREGQTSTGTDIADVVMWKPSYKWPLEGNAGAMAALSWLGENNPKLTADPRSDYWSQNHTPGEWETIAAKVEKVTWAKVPKKERKFTQAQFTEAREELATELDWVANVRAYLSNISQPFTKSSLKGWTEAQALAQKIYAQAQASDQETTSKWFQFTRILLNLAGPLTANVTSTIGGLMDLEMWGFGNGENGVPSYEKINLKAAELGKALESQLEHTAETNKAMAQVIVSDPKKLEMVGENGNCDPGSKKCDKNFSFTEEQREEVAASISRSIQRLSYEQLIPTVYHFYRLNRDREPEQVGGRPRNPAYYACSGEFHPWGDYPVELRKWTYTALLEEPDLDHGGKRNFWRSIVIGHQISLEHAAPPSKEILDRMFDPLPKENNDPAEGGLGMSSEEFLAEQRPWELWDENPNENPPQDGCVWLTEPSS